MTQAFYETTVAGVLGAAIRGFPQIQATSEQLGALPVRAEAESQAPTVLANSDDDIPPPPPPPRNRRGSSRAPERSLLRGIERKKRIEKLRREELLCRAIMGLMNAPISALQPGSRVSRDVTVAEALRSAWVRHLDDILTGDGLPEKHMERERYSASRSGTLSQAGVESGVAGGDDTGGGRIVPLDPVSLTTSLTMQQTHSLPANVQDTEMTDSQTLIPSVRSLVDEAAVSAGLSVLSNKRAVVDDAAAYDVLLAIEESLRAEGCDISVTGSNSATAELARRRRRTGAFAERPQALTMLRKHDQFVPQNGMAPEQLGKAPGLSFMTPDSAPVIAVGARRAVGALPGPKSSKSSAPSSRPKHPAQSQTATARLSQGLDATRDTVPSTRTVRVTPPSRGTPRKSNATFAVPRGTSGIEASSGSRPRQSQNNESRLALPQFDGQAHTGRSHRLTRSSSSGVSDGDSGIESSDGDSSDDSSVSAFDDDSEDEDEPDGVLYTICERDEKKTGRRLFSFRQGIVSLRDPTTGHIRELVFDRLRADLKNY